MQGPETRPSLIGQLVNSESEGAWDAFVKIYQPAIYRIARSRGLQHADAEDLSQDVLARVSQKIGQFDLNAAGSFRGWLSKMTRDLVIDRLRRETKDRGSGDSGMQEQLQQIPSVEETVTLLQLEVKRERLLQACELIRIQFSDPVWNSFWLTAVEQLPISQVAEKLGRSEGAVRVARCRVMSRLKEVVGNDD